MLSLDQEKEISAVLHFLEDNVLEENNAACESIDTVLSFLDADIESQSGS